MVDEREKPSFGVVAPSRAEQGAAVVGEMRVPQAKQELNALRVTRLRFVRSGRLTPRLADARLRHGRRSEPRLREMTVAVPECMEGTRLAVSRPTIGVTRKEQRGVRRTRPTRRAVELHVG
jgi:hypothetical protein